MLNLIRLNIIVLLCHFFYNCNSARVLLSLCKILIHKSTNWYQYLWSIFGIRNSLIHLLLFLSSFRFPSFLSSFFYIYYLFTHAHANREVGRAWEKQALNLCIIISTTNQMELICWISVFDWMFDCWQLFALTRTPTNLDNKK